MTDKQLFCSKQLMSKWNERWLLVFKHFSTKMSFLSQIFFGTNGKNFRNYFIFTVFRLRIDFWDIVWYVFPKTKTKSSFQLNNWKSIYDLLYLWIRLISDTVISYSVPLYTNKYLWMISGNQGCLQEIQLK